MVLRLFLQTFLWLVVLAVLLFLPAGTIAWPAAWFSLIEMGVLGLAVGLWLTRHDPALLAERLGSLMQRDQKPWDRVFMAVFLFLWCAWIVCMALDAERLGWSQIPVWIQGIGAVCLFLSVYIAYLTFRENSFAAPVVKIQKRRGQRTVSTGPYRHVRHPLYGGALFFFIGLPLLLGSWYGLLLVPFMIAVLALRAVMEEHVLIAELDGYADYMLHVRYRFIPLIW